FYLKAAAPGAVTLEVLDAAGKVMRKWPAEAGVGPSGGRGASGLPRVSPLWQPGPEVFSTAAGMHRVVWRPVAPAEPAGPGVAVGGGPRRGGGARLTGTFTARLTVNGRASTQPSTVMFCGVPRSELPRSTAWNWPVAEPSGAMNIP